MILDADNSKRASFVSMWARYVLDTEDWNGDVAKWTIEPGNEPATQLDYQFAHGYAAAQRGDLTTARAALAAYDAASRALNASLPANSATDPETIEFQKGVRVLRLELLGLIAVKSGAVDSGLALIKRATVVEDSTAAAFGPPSIDEPSYELYGEQLLAAGHPKEAMAAFRAALARAPRRTPALLGLARAAAKAGDASTAMQTYQNCGDLARGGRELPGLDEARAGAGGTK